jgi:hypothetical protein
MTRVRVVPLAPHRYGVEVTEGGIDEGHEVIVDDDLLDEMAVFDVDGAIVAEETVDFLLDRLPDTALPRVIDVRAVDRDYDDFRSELTARLADRG